MHYTVEAMTVTPIISSGNSAKFLVVTKQGEFSMALSFTLRTKIWELDGAEAELAAAKELAEAIVSRHDPALPFKPLYIFAEHNCEPSLEKTVQYIRKQGADK